MKILITSPSFRTSENVSGIASHTKLLVDKSNYLVHFKLGRKDSERRNLRWIISQIFNVLKFSSTLKYVDGVHLNMPMEKFSIISCFFYAHVCVLKNKPLLIHLRGGNYSNGRPIPSYLDLLLTKIFRCARCTLLLSLEEKKYMESRFKISNAYSLPNCVYVPTTVSKDKYHFDTLNLVYCGRLVRDKGMTELLGCLDYLQSSYRIHCYIAGSGEAEFIEEFQTRSFISYEGVCGPEKLRELYSKAAIFLLPSYFEGLPNSMLEAMAFGCAPVVTNVGTIGEVVNSQNGRLVAVGDVEALVSAIANLANERSTLEALGTSSHFKVAQKYDIDEYVKDLTNIHRKLIND